MNWKLIFFLQILSFSSMLLPVFAASQTITHTIKQPFAGSQSPDDARTAGISKAKREALEQLGTYIESLTIVKNSHVDSDEILALTAGVTKAEVVKQTNYTEGDTFGIEITVKVEVDNAIVDKSLKSLLDNRNLLKGLRSAREREKKLLKRIIELERQDDQKGKNKQQTAKLKEDFKAVSQELAALDWFDKASALREGIKYSEPEKAIRYLTNAIELEPNFTEAYHLRGYINMWSLNKYSHAIEDYDEALRLEPYDAKLYSFRGQAYLILRQFDSAIANFNQAIELEPNNIALYVYRGGALYEANQNASAIRDYDHAISLEPNYPLAYYNRGVVFKSLNQYGRAVKDFDEAIRLDQNFAHAFDKRGSAYWSLNNIEQGCSNFIAACSLGVCSNYQNALQNGYCR